MRTPATGNMRTCSPSERRMGPMSSSSRLATPPPSTMSSGCSASTTAEAAKPSRLPARSRATATAPGSPARAAAPSASGRDTRNVAAADLVQKAAHFAAEHEPHALRGQRRPAHDRLEAAAAAAAAQEPARLQRQMWPISPAAPRGPRRRRPSRPPRRPTPVPSVKRDHRPGRLGRDRTSILRAWRPGRHSEGGPGSRAWQKGCPQPGRRATGVGRLGRNASPADEVDEARGRRIQADGARPALRQASRSRRRSGRGLPPVPRARPSAAFSSRPGSRWRRKAAMKFVPRDQSRQTAAEACVCAQEGTQEGAALDEAGLPAISGALKGAVLELDADRALVAGVGQCAEETASSSMSPRPAASARESRRGVARDADVIELPAVDSSVL